MLGRKITLSIINLDIFIQKIMRKINLLICWIFSFDVLLQQNELLLLSCSHSFSNFVSEGQVGFNAVAIYLIKNTKYISG
jgi:hypothetical protein